MRAGAAIYVFHAESTGHIFRQAFLDAGLKLAQCLIWEKNAFVLGRQDYQWRHEPCLYGWKEGAAHYFINDRTQDILVDLNGAMEGMTQEQKNSYMSAIAGTNYRLKLEALLKAGHGKQEIADQIGVHVSTIYREIKRGTYTHTNSDLTEEERYSPDIAEDKYQQNLRDKGPDLKIGKDHRLAEYIETKIAEDGYSPGAVLGEIKAKGLEFETEISKPTLYSYIDKGIFLTITNKELPVKGRRKKKNKKVRRQARANAGTSIEKRPEDIDTREEFGHWEMDTVVGKRGESKHSLLVLTERKTRNELIYLLYEHTTEQVCKRLDQLEAEWGERFGQVFKTITVDNGSEFADWEGMQQSATDESEKRVTVFYCHPYCSFERGSNENQNRLVRRKIPKGENFDDRTEDDIQMVEDWINDYPREMFGWKTSGELFQEELARLA